MDTNTRATGDIWAILEVDKAKTIIASILSFLAGSINSISTISILFDRSSHVSGRITDIGIYLVFRPVGALFVAIILISFITGSYLAGILLQKLGLTLSLMLQSLFLLLVAKGVALGLADFGVYDYGYDRAIMAFLLPLPMGFQNAITSQLPLGRTTHWTGCSTDVGIALAKGNYSYLVFTTAKMLAFILGAGLMALMVGVLNIPPFLGLLLTSVCLSLTALAGDRANKGYVSQMLERQASGHLGRIRHPQGDPTDALAASRQHVAIAPALANEPMVVLTDEPTGNLDT